MNTLIAIENCRIENSRGLVVPAFSWKMEEGQSWLVIGPNGGGKADFFNALGGASGLKIVPNGGMTGSHSARVAASKGADRNLANSAALTTTNTSLAKGAEALVSGSFTATPADSPKTSLFSSVFGQSVELVSLERAARIIEEERQNDESDYIEGGVDHGRTGRVFIAEGVIGKVGIMRKSEAFGTFGEGGNNTDFIQNLDQNPAIKLCGIEKILDRGIKYMSTGEIRRTLLARALISGRQLLLLSDPFAGLDVESRGILMEFFDKLAADGSGQCMGASAASGAAGDGASSINRPHIILGMERWHEIPDAITNVLEFSGKKVTFCGSRSDYEKVIEERRALSAETATADTATFDDLPEPVLTVSTAGGTSQFEREVSTLSPDSLTNSAFSTPTDNSQASPTNSTPSPLVEMHKVNVGWDGHLVLKDLNWTLNQGENWLIQGPNGSGKTTLLELITGDNMQVFSNDIKIFGKRRGSGETIWDIKKRLGIVSYRLHVEYRMVGGTSLQNVIISGFRDSIGLYEVPTDLEISAANKWLALGGFQGREKESFSNLSYGEQRAILILRSAVKKPQILILDEPCHGLDENFRTKILALMQKIGTSATTSMLHVTHDPSEILDCEHHVLRLLPGQSPMYRIETR